MKRAIRALAVGTVAVTVAATCLVVGCTKSANRKENAPPISSGDMQKPPAASGATK